ncbi:hypothetical protein ACU4GD_41135 [Cupriavidus basilensis]
MEKLGYVSLEQRPDNRKNIYVFPTPLGRKLKKLLVPLAEEVNALALEWHSGQGSGDDLGRALLLMIISNLGADAQAE